MAQRQYTRVGGLRSRSRRHDSRSAEIAENSRAVFLPAPPLPYGIVVREAQPMNSRRSLAVVIAIATFVIVIAAMFVIPRSNQAQGREQRLTTRFDKDGDGKLNSAERAAAMSALGGGRGFRSGGAARTAAGPKIAPSSVKSVPATVPFYDLG